MPINTSVFAPSIQAKPGFDSLVEAINASPTLVAEINLLPNNSIVLTPDNGNGTFTTGSLANQNAGIDLSSSMYDFYASTGSWGQLAVSISHEVGHAALDGGYGYASQPLTPQEAANMEAGNESVALVNEYNIALEENAPMHSGPEVEQALEGAMLAAVNNGEDIHSAEISAAKDFVGNNLNPSTAPSLTYNQYNQDYFAVAKSGIDPSTINWNSAQPGDLTISPLPDGSYTVNGTLSNKDGLSIDIHGEGDSNGNFVNYDGSTPVPVPIVLDPPRVRIVVAPIDPRTRGRR